VFADSVKLHRKVIIALRQIRCVAKRLHEHISCPGLSAGIFH